MTFIELCLSGARDTFGHPSRSWDVMGWEEGRVPEDYVCWLYYARKPNPAPAVSPARQVKQQMERFA